jgi:hypothetical protein
MLTVVNTSTVKAGTAVPGTPRIPRHGTTVPGLKHARAARLTAVFQACRKGPQDRAADSPIACCATMRMPKPRAGGDAHAQCWNRVVRSFILGLLCALVSAGCTARHAIQLRVDPANEWETLMRAGCFSCLRHALGRLESAALRQDSPDVTHAAFSTAALLVVRARELGLPDGLYMERAASGATASKRQLASFHLRRSSRPSN